jgi:hypothetical protein
MNSSYKNQTLALIVGLSLATVGCSEGRFPVHGTVTRDDGAPIKESLVVFESIDRQPNITARGDVGANGEFELGTGAPGDGAPAGKYRVKVTQLMSNPDEPPQVTFDPRFGDFNTSGLELEVKRGPNDFAIKVTRASGKNRKR